MEKEDAGGGESEGGGEDLGDEDELLEMEVRPADVPGASDGDERRLHEVHDAREAGGGGDTGDDDGDEGVGAEELIFSDEQIGVAGGEEDEGSEAQE